MRHEASQEEGDPSASPTGRPVGIFNRRALLFSAAVTPAGLLQPGAATARQAGRSTLRDTGYFLSPGNPIANVDQKAAEAQAIALRERADVQAALKAAAGTWRIVTDKLTSPEQWALFEAQAADYGFYCILEAVNSDPNAPKVVRALSPAARWLGHDAPASKWGGDNPDNAYRDIPVEHGGRYVLHGQRQATPPADASYQLRGETPALIGTTLGERDMQVGDDGAFAITLDETAAAGRSNHLQLLPWTAVLGVRDSMSDWRQTPNALRIERVNAPSRGRLSEDELAERAIVRIKSGVHFAYWAIRVVMNGPENTLHAPQGGSSYAGLPTQVSAAGSFRIGDDEAVVVTANAAGAGYRSIVLYDRWNRSLDYRDHQSHLNSGFMAPDADGTFTFVAAARDPQIHNWLDTQGFHEFFIGHRWQAISTSSAERPTIRAEIVKLSQLDTSVGPGVARATPTQRLDQLATRRALYDRRFIDS